MKVLDDSYGVPRSRDQRVEFKRRCVAYKGGKCQRCGYDKCLRAMHFHHRDPLTKNWEIAGYCKVSLELPKEELDKCDLVCANCHIEIHDENNVLAIPPNIIPLSSGHRHHSLSYYKKSKYYKPIENDLPPAKPSKPVDYQRLDFLQI